MKIKHLKSNKKAVESLKKILVKIRLDLEPDDVIKFWNLPKLKKPVTVDLGSGVVGKHATEKQAKLIWDYAKKVLKRKPSDADLGAIFKCDGSIDKYEGHYMQMYAEVF